MENFWYVTTATSFPLWVSKVHPMLRKRPPDPALLPGFVSWPMVPAMAHQIRFMTELPHLENSNQIFLSKWRVTQDQKKNIKCSASVAKPPTAVGPFFIPREPLDPYNYVLHTEKILPKLTSTCQCSRNSSSSALASSTKIHVISMLEDANRAEQGTWRNITWNFAGCQECRWQLETQEPVVVLHKPTTHA